MLTLKELTRIDQETTFDSQIHTLFTDFRVHFFREHDLFVTQGLTKLSQWIFETRIILHVFDPFHLFVFQQIVVNLGNIIEFDGNDGVSCHRRRRE